MTDELVECSRLVSEHTGVPAAWVMPFIPGGRFPGYLFILAAVVALRRHPLPTTPESAATLSY